MFPAACYPKSNTRGGAPAFVGPLDALISQGATLRHASSVRRLLSSYTGPACKLRGNGAGTLEDINYLADGSLDLATAAALAVADGGTQALWHTSYDNAELVNAVQATDGSQPLFGVDYEAKGAMQGAGASRFLGINLGTLPNPSFVSFLINDQAGTGTRHLLGTSASGSAYCRRSNAVTQQSWGALLASGAGSAGKHTLGFLVNGASSVNYINGTQDGVGDTGNTLLDMSAAMIGRSASALAVGSWFGSTGNTISEFIVFDGDPTGLAGWSDFVTAQKAYFGIA